MSEARPFACAITARRMLGPRVLELCLRRHDLRRLDFEPGQYVVAQLDGDSRPFSLSRPPDPSGSFCVCVQHAEGDRFAQRLVACEVGDEIAVVGPRGRFALPSPIATDLLLIATGSGIAPFRAMLDLLRAPTEGRQRWLLFGARTEDDLLYDADWRGLAAAQPSFRYLPVLSRAGADSRWAGARGRVQSQLECPPLASLDPRHTLCYLCGSPEMVQETTPLLLRRGFSEDAVRVQR